MKTITKRILTSLIAAPATIALLLVAKRGGFPWAVRLLLAAAAVAGAWEFFTLTGKLGIRIRAKRTALLGGLGFFVYCFFSPNYGLLVGAVTLVAAVSFNLRSQTIKKNLKASFVTILGLAYIPGLLHFFYLIYLPESGIIYAINFLLIVWSYDSGAYLFGKRFGKHKLAPKISPNKTLEGVLGGVLLAVLGALLSLAWTPYHEWLPHLGFLAVSVGLASQAGDLFASWLKRSAGVQDAGSLFPGHGGVLDRIDGLLFALPVFYLYVNLVLDFL